MDKTDGTPVILRQGKVAKTYTKKDVVARTSELMGAPLRSGGRWVDAVFQALRETMTNGDSELRIEIRDFGVFEVKHTRAKPKARNPQTGETIVVPPHRKSHFKPGKLLKKYLSKPLESDPDSVNTKRDDGEA